MSGHHTAARWGRVLLFGLLVLSATSCGSSRWGGPVSGKVVLADGSPLKSGAVTFINSAGDAANAEIKEDGTYLIERTPIGECKITVTTVPPPPPSGVLSLPADAGKSPFADRYRKAETTELKCTVSSAAQTYDINLKP
jgi:hypothetical protein